MRLDKSSIVPGSMALAVVLLMLTAGAVFARDSRTAPSNEGLDAFVKHALAEYGVPGAAVAVVRDDRVELCKGYGLRQQGASAPVDENTIFMLASNTKPFTAALLATFVDEGKLGWDDHIIEHLPQFALLDPYPTRMATPRDLLAHRSGLPAFTGDILERLGIDRAQILHRIRYVKPGCSFREKAAYSNLGYFAAGMIAAHRGGASWEDLVQSRLFKRMGMTRSGASIQSAGLLENASAAHMVDPDGHIRVIGWDNPRALGPAGSISSTASDMARWMRMQLHEGELDGQRVISAAAIRQMHAPSMVADLSFAELPPIDDHSGFSFGMGWDIYHYQGYEIVEKAGARAGVRSIVTLVPAKQIGIVILANLNLTVLPEAVRAYFLEANIAPSRRDLQREIKQRQTELLKAFAVRPPKIAPTPPRLPLDRYAGTYENKLYGRARVRVEGGTLRWVAGSDNFGGTLEHIGYETFLLKYPDGIIAMPELVTFVVDVHGQPQTLLTDALGELHRVKGSTPSKEARP